MKTKLIKTYEILKNRNIYGIHSFDLMREAGTTRVAARVCDLKKQGYIIESKRETLHGVEGCRYILRGQKTDAKEVTKPVIKYQFIGSVAVPITN